MRYLTFLFIASLILGFFPRASAQEESYTNVLRKTGNLVTLELVPGAKKIRVNVVGNNIADFRFEKTSIKAYIKTDAELRKVPVIKKDSYYVIPGQTVPNLTIEVKYNDKVEKFDFKP